MRELVFLPGFTGAPSDFDPVVALLADGTFSKPSVVSPWLLGHGPSFDDQAAPVSLEAGSLEAGALEAGAPAFVPEAFEIEVDRLARICEERLTAPAHLVGYSLGGRLGLGLLVRHPKLFRSATLISAHPGLATEAERELRKESDEHWCGLLLAGAGSWDELRRQRNLQSFSLAWEDQPLFAGERRLPAEVRARVRARRLSHDPRGLALSLRRAGLGQMPPYRERLAGLGQRITLMAGAEDAKFLALAQEMERRIHHARLDAVEGSGHNVLVERPARVAGLLKKELSS